MTILNPFQTHAAEFQVNSQELDMVISTTEKPNTYRCKDTKVEPITFPYKVLVLKKKSFTALLFLLSPEIVRRCRTHPSEAA